MIILALESTAQSASAALLRDGNLIGESYLRCGLTHSATLLPLAEDLLKNSGIALQEIDYIAAANGPGSFTGLRIGLGTAKGLAFAADKECIAVSTLEGIAESCALACPFIPEAILCCSMDARVKQVYNALFLLKEGTLSRMTEDRAVSLEELGNELAKETRTIIVSGDGTDVVMKALGERITMRCIPEPFVWQRASAVAYCAWKKALTGDTIPCSRLSPEYLRLPQAERERLERLKKQQQS